MSRKNSVLSGAAILFAANIIVKLTGVAFKIPVQRLIGDTGMGYFNVAYNIYIWFYLLSTSGLPIAVSVCVARASAEGKAEKCGRIYNTSAAVFSSIGAVFTAVMMLFCKSLSSLSGIDNSYLCIAMIAPSVLAACISSAVRGYYQGFGIMWVTAASQVIESSGKAVFGIIFAYISVKYGNALYVTSAYAILGITLGTVLSAVFCLTIKSFYKKTKCSQMKCKENVLPQILKTALPVTLSSSVMNLSALSDVFIAPSRLISIGYTEAQATEIFGNYSTLCVSFANLPTAFIYPLTSAALPALSYAYASKDKERAVELAYNTLKTALFISLPCAVGLGVLSYQALSVVFPAQSSALAAPMLTALSPSVVLCGMLAVTDTLLQSCGKPVYPVISMLFGAGVKIASMLLLFKVPSFDRLAIPAGTCLCYLTALIFNVRFCSADFKIKNIPELIIKPAFCSAVCGVFAYALCGYLSNYISGIPLSAISILSASAVYLITVIISGYIRPGSIIKGIIKIKGNKNGSVSKKREVQLQ